jgi:hypothetical protein
VPIDSSFLMNEFFTFFAIITVRVLDPDAALSSKVVKQISKIVRFCSRLPITTTYWVLVLTYISCT